MEVPKLIVNSFLEYREKFFRASKYNACVPHVSEYLWTFIGCILGIGTVTYLTYLQGIPVLVASLGASACLIYGVPAAPFSQPRNAVLGHLLSAFVGVAIYQLLGNYWYAATISVGMAVILMLITGTVHPPAAATALIGVVSQQDWFFLLLPVGVGICILVLIGMLINNIAKTRQYPIYWW